MRKASQLILSLAALAGFASSALAQTAVSVNINGYLPAPPGVQVYLVGGRPCYREGGRVVYLEKDRRHHKRGHAYGHREHDNRGGRGRGHGHGKHD